MSIQKIIQESINSDAISLKETLAEELRARVAAVLESKKKSCLGTEELEELNKSTLVNYIGQASADKSYRAHEMGKQNALGREHGRPRDAEFHKDNLKHRNRSGGIQLAAHKLAGSSKVSAKNESVEGDVVNVHSHIRGTDTGKYGSFNIEKVTPTQIHVYDHKQEKT